MSTSLNRSGHLVSRDILEVPLTHQVEPGTWVEGGWPTATSETLALVGGAAVTLWEITTGVVTDVETDEVLLVLAGQGSVTFDDGDRLDLAPSVVVRLHAGEHAEWTITTPMRVMTISAAYGGPGQVGQ